MWKVAVGFFAALGFVPLMSGQAPQSEWPMKWGVEAQPLIAQTNRIASAMEILGQPLDPKIARTLKALRETQGNDAVAKAVQEALDPLCLAAVEVGPTGVTRVIPGRSVPLLVEQGWTLALVKVINQLCHQGGQSQVRERGRHGPHWVSGEALLGGDLSCDRV